jgi:transcription-repair coupling factor (superfamily II helicase)
MLSISQNCKKLSSSSKGAFPFIVADFFAKSKEDIIIICNDDVESSLLLQQLNIINENIPVINYPAWDIMPYDVVSPHTDIMTARIKALYQLLNTKQHKKIIITTLRAIYQKTLTPKTISDAVVKFTINQSFSRDKVISYLMSHGYSRASSAREAGDFAVRGSIIDIVVLDNENGLRLDFFGDVIDSIREYDTATQISVINSHKEYTIFPASEVILTNENIENFKQNYRLSFGSVKNNDHLFESIIAGRKTAGSENWLPLFYADPLVSLIDFIPNAQIITSSQFAANLHEFTNVINDHYDNRKIAANIKSDSNIYHPIEPNSLWLEQSECAKIMAESVNISNFKQSDYQEIDNLAPLTFFTSDTQNSKIQQIKEFRKIHNLKTIICTTTMGAFTRIQNMLNANDLHVVVLNKWSDQTKLSNKSFALIMLPLEAGFYTDKYLVVSDSDILGERIDRIATRKRKVDNFLSEAASLNVGEIIVHKEYGIGKFEGLETVKVNNKSHDCLLITYDGGDKLFIPVENMEVISRYGTEEAARLDKLGGTSWQLRKAKLKNRIKLAAEFLLKIAAERHLHTATIITPPEGEFDDFCAKFPYMETEDQLSAIEDVIEDFASQKPMDRLICGDVGFGKTEIAMRAAFIAARNNGIQVALVAPTTLLARQHYNNFIKRFQGFPVRIRQLSRLVAAKEANAVKNAIKEGEVDIVIGTHAVLAKDITFKNIGLLIIDEEQHFGVAQKERLKDLKNNVHVLTLTATPIPRTLQMSLTGIKELSLIATPPVDRLAVRTFVTPFDPLVIKEALLQEYNRGGRSFYVCPRINDLTEINNAIRELAPNLKTVIAHGQMQAIELDKIMNDFYDGAIDVLISTTIVESGLDVPSANTIIIHRADMFGLSQLYQLRGRVGRGKIRGFAYLTTPRNKRISDIANKRLEVMQKLDSLGAGFSLATHDMDIRGFGNLLGDEQSGHIREVGVELYQEMLKDTIKQLQENQTDEQIEEQHLSPQVNIGVSVLIPEEYISDLSLRLGLYKRISALKSKQELEIFEEELINRFGPIPVETNQLLSIINIKQKAMLAHIAKIDVGEKGILITFHNNQHPNPTKLLQYVIQNQNHIKIRPDQKLVIITSFKNDEHKIKLITDYVETLGKITS